jgi:uncharacterized cupin superfamily protein
MPSRVFKHRSDRAVVLPMMLSAMVALSSPVVAQAGAGSPSAASKAAHPFKIAAGDPTALTTPDVQTDTSDGHVTKDRVMGISQDRHFKSGLSSFQGGQGSIDSYPVDEFMYFIKGGVTLTSTDGTVLQAGAGEAIYIPKGWKGTWDAKTGYTKFYVVYDAVKPAE